MAKNPAQSKTLWFNLLGFVAFEIIKHQSPKFADSVCKNQNLTIMVGLMAMQIVFGINALLRLVTKDKIGFSVLLLALSACSSVPQKLDTNVFYRRDLPVCEESFGCFEGLAVLPRKEFYKFSLEPKGGAEIDLFVATTAHRNDSFEPTHSSWLFWKKKNSYEYLYKPNPELENDGDNTLVFQTFEKSKGRHSWGVILFSSPNYQLPYTLYCNGFISELVGVGGCQSKTGLKQGVKFKEPVMIEADKDCPMPKKVNGLYEFGIGYKQCGYTSDHNREKWERF